MGSPPDRLRLAPAVAPFSREVEQMALPCPQEAQSRMEGNMITLYNFGPAFGLPDPSPFVTKAEVLLKMANVPYRTDGTGFRKAPKGKVPYIDDDGEIIPDSTFIRWHLEKKYGVDFDRGFSPE